MTSSTGQAANPIRSIHAGLSSSPAFPANEFSSFAFGYSSSVRSNSFSSVPKTTTANGPATARSSVVHERPSESADVPTSSPTTTDAHLSSGAQAGIGAGVGLLIIAAIGLFIWYILPRSKRHSVQRRSGDGYIPEQQLAKHESVTAPPHENAISGLGIYEADDAAVSKPPTYAPEVEAK